MGWRAKKKHSLKVWQCVRWFRNYFPGLQTVIFWFRFSFQQKFRYLRFTDLQYEIYFFFCIVYDCIYVTYPAKMTIKQNRINRYTFCGLVQVVVPKKFSKVLGSVQIRSSATFITSGNIANVVIFSFLLDNSFKNEVCNTCYKQQNVGEKKQVYAVPNFYSSVPIN